MRDDGTPDTLLSRVPWLLLAAVTLLAAVVAS